MWLTTEGRDLSDVCEKIVPLLIAALFAPACSVGVALQDIKNADVARPSE